MALFSASCGTDTTDPDLKNAIDEVVEAGAPPHSQMTEIEPPIESARVIEVDWDSAPGYSDPDALTMDISDDRTIEVEIDSNKTSQGGLQDDLLLVGSTPGLNESETRWVTVGPNPRLWSTLFVPSDSFYLPLHTDSRPPFQSPLPSTVLEELEEDDTQIDNHLQSQDASIELALQTPDFPIGVGSRWTATGARFETLLGSVARAAALLEVTGQTDSSTTATVTLVIKWTDLVGDAAGTIAGTGWIRWTDDSPVIEGELTYAGEYKLPVLAGDGKHTMKLQEARTWSART